MFRVQVTIDVPESELPRVQAVMTARLPQNWQYISHRRVPQRAGVASRQEKTKRTADVEPPLVATASATQSAEQVHMRNVWVDSVLGCLEDHPPCPHCLMGPCITVGELTLIQGSCAPDITNHTKRHKNYRQFWKSLKDRGLWQHELYINRKTSAGLSEIELRELMPQCALDDTRKRYPNPPGVPYMGHKRA